MKEFDIIYQEYAEKLYKFTVKLCGDSHIAEDIVQTTFLKAFESADKFKGNCQVYTWLCTIARNEYFNYIKRKDNKNISSDETPEISDDESIYKSLEDKEQSMIIHKAIHLMNEPYREILTLRIMGELSFSQIGCVFDKSENWARVTFFRAKNKLVELLKEDNYEL